MKYYTISVRLPIFGGIIIFMKIEGILVPEKVTTERNKQSKNNTSFALRSESKASNCIVIYCIKK